MFKQLFIAMMLCIAQVTLVSAQDLFLPNEQSNIPTISENNDVPKDETKGTIYLKKTFWNVKYVKNGEAHRLGFWAKNLKKEFKGNAAAEAEFVKYRKSLGAGLGIGIVGMTLSYIGLYQFAERNINNSGEPKVAASDVNLYLGGIGVSLIGAGISNTGGFNHLNKAIYLHNEALSKR